MQIQDVTTALFRSARGARDLDLEIAQAIGWTTRKIDVKDAASGFTVLKTVWFDPGTDQPASIPYYTTDIQAAYELCMLLASDDAGAVVIESTGTRAAIGDQAAVYHSDPAIALCIAALQSLK